jgi:hypothetical protein
MVSANRIGGKEFLNVWGLETRAGFSGSSRSAKTGSRPIFFKIFVDYLRSFAKVAPPVERMFRAGRVRTSQGSQDFLTCDYEKERDEEKYGA